MLFMKQELQTLKKENQDLRNQLNQKQDCSLDDTVSPKEKNIDEVAVDPLESIRQYEILEDTVASAKSKISFKF